jgi:uroporphyrinogen decarboxylase
MPAQVDWTEYFDDDKFAYIGTDNSPQYESKIIEQTDTYRIKTTEWGSTLREWKHAGGVPEFLNFTIVDADSWRKAKERMTPTRNRINWEYLAKNYPVWRKQGYWISAGLWFGFDVSHSWMVGTERLLMSMATEPEWVVDMWNHQLDMNLQLLQMAWDEGYTFDAIEWPDDMGYKNSQFFSIDMYRDLLKPVHKRACDWAHAKKIKVHLHSCGDVRPLVPELIEIGVDMLNPLEVKAGMDPKALKREYGNTLAFHGGLNAVLYDDLDKLEAEMRAVIPVMKEHGGYIASTDHSVPDSVDLKTFKRFVQLAKELGKY